MKGEKQRATAFEVGKSYLIRTVTHYYTGRLKAIYQKELVLEKAAWVADTGRFHEALAKGHLSEIEPFVGEVIVSRGAMVDATEWKHTLPQEVK